MFFDIFLMNMLQVEHRIQISYATKKSNSEAFLNHALSLGADAIATGHYARIHPATTTNCYEALILIKIKAIFYIR